MAKETIYRCDHCRETTDADPARAGWFRVADVGAALVISLWNAEAPPDIAAQLVDGKTLCGAACVAAFASKWTQKGVAA